MFLLLYILVNQANIRDLFEPTQDQEGEMESSNIDQPIKEEPVTSEGDSQNMSEKQLGKMLAEVEDENDVKAASRAEAEQAAELAEFDEAFMETGEHSTSQVSPSCSALCVCRDFIELLH